MPGPNPPFRADHVGSLLRPKDLQAARAAWKAGTMPMDALREPPFSTTVVTSWRV